VNFPKKIDIFAKGLEDCLSSGAFAIENKILDDIYSRYGSFRKIKFERTPVGYDFVSQIKIVMQKS
jgi:hypothetical protein